MTYLETSVENEKAYNPAQFICMYTPADRDKKLSGALWLNQAEILLKCFEVRYLQRGNWTSRQHLIDHLYASTPEYNRLWAQPINWSWTRRDLREWAEKKSAGLC